MIRVVLVIFAGVLFTQYGVAGERELIRDPSFSAGYEVVSPVREKYKKKPVIGAVHNIHTPSQQPSWRLVQWGSKKDLSGVTPEFVPDGPVSWSYVEHKNDKTILYKKVAIQSGYPMPDGSKYNSLMLELNGLAEFSAIHAGNKEQTVHSIYLSSHHNYWPHLLMMQEIDSDPLDRYKSLVMKFDARLLFDHKNIQPSGYNEKLHAARFVVGVLVTNTLHGGSFWLMMPVYDDRYQESGFSCKKCNPSSMEDCQQPTSLNAPGIWSCGYDGSRAGLSFRNYPIDTKQGSHHLIFRIPTRSFSRGDFSTQWSQQEVDLIPYLRAGIEAHQYSDLHNHNQKTTITDPVMFYNIRLLTIGWEITGLNHAAVELKSLSLKGIE